MRKTNARLQATESNLVATLTSLREEKMDGFVHTESKPLSTLSVFSFIPPRRNEPKERSYFNSNPKVADVSNILGP